MIYNEKLFGSNILNFTYDVLDIINDEIKAIKNWIKNTVVKELADSAIKILEADKMEVELMVARNAYILEEMKDKAKEEGRAE